MVYLVQLITFLVTLFVTQGSEALRCPVKWFGENCMYQCMCFANDQCDNKGNCPGNKCVESFFGPGCQFRDRTSNSLGKQITWLNDNDNATCNPNATATMAQIKLADSYLFMWFRIEVKDERAIKRFDVIRNTNTVCHNERRFYGNKMVDVMCANQDPADVLTIRGDIAPDVCSLSISGGRNVALKQNVSLSTTRQGVENTEASNAVDGNVKRNIESNTCVHTTQQNDPSFEIKFNRPQYILYMYIYNRNAWEYRLRLAKVQMFRSNHSLFYTYTTSATVDYDIYYFNGNITSQTSEVKIVAYNNPNFQTGLLQFCELQTFSETVCPDLAFGLWCEQTCSCSATEACNPVTGVCTTGCNNGFYGLNCSLPCSTFCLDNTCSNVQGKCFQCVPGKEGVYCEIDCQSGFYGVNCSTPCSALCDAGLCVPADGKCYHCPAGFKGSYCSDACDVGHYGLTCSMLCVNSCKDGICKNIDGRCVECYPGYEGDFCEKACQAGFFGNKCATWCPRNCEDVCDHVTGNCTCRAGFAAVDCSDCATGLYGVNCTEKCSITCSNKKCNINTGECISCVEEYTGKFCEVQKSAPPTGFENWWLIMLLVSGLTVAVCGTLFLWGKRVESSTEEK